MPEQHLHPTPTSAWGEPMRIRFGCLGHVVWESLCEACVSAIRQGEMCERSSARTWNTIWVTWSWMSEIRGDTTIVRPSFTTAGSW